MKHYLPGNLRHLRNAKRLTQEQLAVALGLKRATVGAWEEGRAEPRARVLQSLSAYFNVSIDALLLQDMTHDKYGQSLTTSNLRILPIAIDKDRGEELITVVPVRAAAGYLSGFGDMEFIASLPTFSLPVNELPQDMTLRLFQIEGDSMLPLKSGSYVLASYVEDKNNSGNRHPYVAVTKDDGIVFKRIENQLKKKGVFKMISDNPEFAPYDMEADKVLELWRARAYISFDLDRTTAHSADHGDLKEINHRLKSIEERLNKVP